MSDERRHFRDAKERMAYARAHRHNQPKVLELIGPPPPVIDLPAPTRPPETFNPVLAASEPYTLPAPTKPVRQLGEGDPRSVTEADIEELLEWGLPRYQEIYPRCVEDSVRPMLVLATRGGRMRFLRTKDCCSLFVAETTPWEPELFVYQVFVVARINTGNCYKEAYRLIRESRRWAESIGAIGFEFGKARCSVNLRNSSDFLTRLSAIIPDQKNESWVKILRKPPVETAEIPPNARMLAMGMGLPSP